MLAPPPPGAYVPSSAGPHAMQLEQGRAPRPRRLQPERSGTDPSGKPLKSAMKKPGRADPANLHRPRTVPVMDNDTYFTRPSELKPAPSNMSRGRSMSESKRPRATSLSRPRSRSQSRRNLTPGHLFLSFSGTSRFNIASVVYQDTVDTVRERVLTMWPDGVIFQTYRDDTNEFLVQFSGNPWTARSSLGLMAMKLILELFAVLARQGYTCTSVIDTVSSPRLVFSLGLPDLSAEFAMLVFSSGRRKIKLVNQPHQLCDSLTEVLRESFPRRIRSAAWDDNDMYKIEMSRLDFDHIADFMVAIILEHTTNSGFKLEGTIPLANSGFWGLIHGRKELWVFRRLPSHDT
ncbi:hypothetical protein EW145_g5976 [Phellinidium pouzarii]|uniref:Uncharacterized protein n=1 Tax=Phellinidium pouzarii TaxID=167371 RepID=A0A4S4KZD4_9AGAM|nr:hypothetical protein EW145_g5976 [Phellinidium pouzarii]